MIERTSLKVINTQRRSKPGAAACRQYMAWTGRIITYDLSRIHTQEYRARMLHVGQPNFGGVNRQLQVLWRNLIHNLERFIEVLDLDQSSPIGNCFRNNRLTFLLAQFVG